MRLMMQDLSTSLSQSMRSTKVQHVGTVRPHIYLHNNPTGNLKVQICSSGGDLIAESDTIDFSAMTTYPEFHGVITFEVEASLQKDIDYVFKIVAGGGYSFNESSFCGWCNDFDLRIYEMTSPDTDPRNAPLRMEIWTLSNK